MANIAASTTSAGSTGSGAAAALPGGGGKGGAGKTTGWQLPQLGRDFRLNAALDQAVSKAARSINKSLGAEGLMVSVPQGAEQSGAEDHDRTIKVTEKETNAVLKTYDTVSFLAFYAAREKTHGLIVDGQV